MDGRVRVAVIEQVGYREWTESLGSDREWYIQMVQSRVYRAGQEAATRVGGFLLPLRFDIMLLIASRLSSKEVDIVHSAVERASTVRVRTASSCGDTPLEATDRAWRLLMDVRPGQMTFEPCDGDELVAVAHIDVNNITRLTRKLGPLRTYYMVLDTINRVRSVAEDLGAVVQYLGGDNLLAILPPTGSVETVARKLVEGPGDLKAGVGVAGRARDSLALAAKALHLIRLGKAKGPVLALYEAEVLGGDRS